MKKHNAIKVVLIALLVCLVLSWIIPAAYFSSEFVDQGRTQMGLFDLFNYPLTALSYFGYIVLFFVLVGGFYGILYKIPAYRTFLDKIASNVNGKIFIPIVMVILTLLVSLCGVQLEMFIFVPFIISLIFLLGYDKFVAALTVVGSAAVGLAGTTFGYSNLSVLLSSLGLKLDYDIWVRVVILIIGLVLLIFNTLLYMKNSGSVKPKEIKAVKKVEPVKVSTKTKKVSSKSAVKNNKKSSSAKSTKKPTKKTTKSASSKKVNKAAVYDEDVIVVSKENYLVPSGKGEKHSTWPMIVIFSILFVILVIAFLPWGEGGFGLDAFDNATKSVTEFKVFGFALFGKILGTTNAFGAWSLSDLFLILGLSVLVLALLYKVKFDDVLDGFAAGAKKALAPALIVLLVYTILVTVTYHPFQLTIYKALLGMTKGFNIVTTTLVAILASIFNVDFSYVCQSVLPYLVSVVGDKSLAAVGIIFQSIYGLSVLFAPTSLVLLAVLSILDIRYLDWLKKIWKFLVEFLIVLLIIFIFLA